MKRGTKFTAVVHADSRIEVYVISLAATELEGDLYCKRQKAIVRSTQPYQSFINMCKETLNDAMIQCMRAS